MMSLGSRSLGREVHARKRQKKGKWVLLKDVFGAGYNNVVGNLNKWLNIFTKKCFKYVGAYEVGFCDNGTL